MMLPGMGRKARMTIHGRLGASWLALMSTAALAANSHPAQGVLLELDAKHHRIVVSCDAIPGYMDAMAMPFAVRDWAAAQSLKPGATVRFTIVERGHDEFADHLEAVAATNYEPEPTEAGRLTILHEVVNPSAAAKEVAIGAVVPDFALTDQAQRATHLEQFRGKVVALTFAYARCPNPNYCFRLSNNLWELSRRFRPKTDDLVLMTIVIDPANDQGKALESFAGTWKADPERWRFLTGSVTEIEGIAELFGMHFWSDEGFLTHSFHTVVIDRQGRLAGNLEGNQFTAKQLGDLVETVLKRQ